MSLLFCVRPATRNIGNDVINRATSELLLDAFGAETGIVNIPALRGPQFGGFTVRQVYEMNRFADAVVLGGGNLFENGQVTIEPVALAALRAPLLLIGLSHGRIYPRGQELVERTDGLPDAHIKQLLDKASGVLVRDESTKRRLDDISKRDVVLAGCPTLLMKPNPAGVAGNQTVLLSIRHPGRMSVPPKIQWRVAEDVRRLIARLQSEFGNQVVLVCHDYADIEFASGFPEAPMIYFDDVDRYIRAMRECRLNVSYRLHAFLPCLAFGAPTIHISYDERGSGMLATIGMVAWDIDMLRVSDVAEEVVNRARNLDRFFSLRKAAMTTVESFRNVTMAAISEFCGEVAAYREQQKAGSI